MVRHLLSLALACAALGASALPLNPVRSHNHAVSALPESDRLVAAPVTLTFPAADGAFRAPASRADDAESVNFTWADLSRTSPMYLENMKVGDVVWQAVEMDEATVNKFAGNKISAISFITPTTRSYANPVSSVTLFLTYDLNGTPFYTQTASLEDKGFELTQITLDTPYVIEAGKPVYFGYYFSLSQAATNGGVYYIFADGKYTENYSAGWIKAPGTDGKPVTFATGTQCGALCIVAEITGDKLPRNTVTPMVMYAPVGTTPGKPFELVLLVANEAVNKVSSIEVEYTLGSQTKSEVIPLSEPIGYEEYTVCAVPNLTTDLTGFNIPVSLRITKLNGGDDNLAADEVITDVFNGLPEGVGYDRNVVVEEATGTWCGWCPLGIGLMEYAAEHYNDGTLIPIAMHYNDDMAIDSYLPVLQTYIPGFPSYIANRDGVYLYQFGGTSTFEDYKQDLQSIYSELRSYKAAAKVSMSAAYADETKAAAKVSVDTEFALANEVGFRVAIVLTEDGMGPYRQHNYLTNLTDYVGYESWIRSGEWVNWIFDDVARFISNPTGVPTSLPVAVESGKPYHYDFTLDLSGVKPEKCSVIALLINSYTGEIENAAMTTIASANGVDSAVADGSALTVSGLSGAVAFSGEYTSASIYNAAGALVATAAGESTVALPAGLYIVKADDTVAKVIVR